MTSGESFVFVSYTGADEPWATWVASVLESAGLTARIQVWDSPPGTNFVEWMNAQLAGARWTVALYSEAYFASKWCTTEWTASLAQHTLLPVRLEPVEPPAILQMVTWVDLFNLSEERAREKVLQAVGKQVIPRLATFPKENTSPAWPPGTKSIQSVSGIDLTESIKMLTSESSAGRIGGVHSLARVATDFPEERQAVITILSEFVCEMTRNRKGILGNAIESDIQAALAALGGFPDPPELIRAHLCGANLSRANLSGLNFSRADMNEAVFDGTRLRDTKFQGVELHNADLFYAIDLEDGQLDAAFGGLATRLPNYIKRPKAWPPYIEGLFYNSSGTRQMPEVTGFKEVLPRLVLDSD